MAGMVQHTGQALNDGSHPGQSPQISPETAGARPLAEGPVHSLQVLAVQLRLAPRPASPAQGGDAALSPLSVPATDALATHLRCPSDRGQNLAGAKQLAACLLRPSIIR